MTKISSCNSHAQTMQTFAAQMSEKNFQDIKKRLNEKPLRFQSYKHGMPFEVNGDMLNIKAARQVNDTFSWLPAFVQGFVLQVQSAFEHFVVKGELNDSEDLRVGVVVTDAGTKEEALQVSQSSDDMVTGHLEQQIQQHEGDEKHPAIITFKDIVIGSKLYTIFVQPNKYEPDKG